MIDVLGSGFREHTLSHTIACSGAMEVDVNMEGVEKDSGIFCTVYCLIGPVVHIWILGGQRNER